MEVTLERREGGEGRRLGFDVFSSCHRKVSSTVERDADCVAVPRGGLRFFGYPKEMLTPAAQARDQRAASSTARTHGSTLARNEPLSSRSSIPSATAKTASLACWIALSARSRKP